MAINKHVFILFFTIALVNCFPQGDTGYFNSLSNKFRYALKSDIDSANQYAKKLNDYSVKHIQNLSMLQQKVGIEKSFNNWKGNLEQVDDLTVIGIKFLV